MTINHAITTTAEAYAPATVANLGVGFDVLGLALSEPGDVIRAEWTTETRGIFIREIEGDSGKLPREPKKNTACVSAESAVRAAVIKCGGEIERLVSERGIALTIIKGLPAASGLGSSAASAVAGALVVNALMGEPLTRGELLPACLDGEAVASGYHPDNVAPCLFGGITLATGLTADVIFQLPVPQKLCLALVTPDVEVPTSKARAALPKEIPLKSMVQQTAAIAQLIHALHRGDIELLAAAMERDVVIEPAREHLMPYLKAVRAAAKQAGALALTISGAGPTLCAVCDSDEVASHVSEAMKTVYDNAGIESVARATAVAHGGARIL